jgi:NADH:ubiquinone oxidoreductase subunit 6 (subunit J)
MTPWGDFRFSILDSRFSILDFRFSLFDFRIWSFANNRMLTLIAFGTLSAVALASGIMVITRRNAVHSIIWLIVTLFAVGGIFLLQHAEFLFAVQIILYVGGIMVLFLFVVMLVNLDVALKQAQFSRMWPLGLFTALLVFARLSLRVRSRRTIPRRSARPFTKPTCCPSKSPRSCSWWQ